MRSDWLRSLTFQFNSFVRDPGTGSNMADRKQEVCRNDKWFYKVALRLPLFVWAEWIKHGVQWVWRVRGLHTTLSPSNRCSGGRNVFQRIQNTGTPGSISNTVHTCSVHMFSTHIDANLKAISTLQFAIWRCNALLAQQQRKEHLLVQFRSEKNENK